MLTQFRQAPLAGGLQDFVVAGGERLNDRSQIESLRIGGSDHRVSLHASELGSPEGGVAVSLSKCRFIHRQPMLKGQLILQLRWFQFCWDGNVSFAVPWTYHLADIAAEDPILHLFGEFV